MKNNKNTILLAILLIAFAAVSRIISHEMQWFNLAPVAAVGLFAGNVIKDKKYAFLFAILAQLAGDIYIELFTKWQDFTALTRRLFMSLYCLLLFWECT